MAVIDVWVDDLERQLIIRNVPLSSKHTTETIERLVTQWGEIRSIDPLILTDIQSINYVIEYEEASVAKLVYETERRSIRRTTGLVVDKIRYYDYNSRELHFERRHKFYFMADEEVKSPQKRAENYDLFLEEFIRLYPQEYMTDCPVKAGGRRKAGGKIGIIILYFDLQEDRKFFNKVRKLGHECGVLVLDSLELEDLAPRPNPNMARVRVDYLSGYELKKDFRAKNPFFYGNLSFSPGLAAKEKSLIIKAINSQGEDTYRSHSDDQSDDRGRSDSDDDRAHPRRPGFDDGPRSQADTYELKEKATYDHKETAKVVGTRDGGIGPDSQNQGNVIKKSKLKLNNQSFVPTNAQPLVSLLANAASSFQSPQLAQMAVLIDSICSNPYGLEFATVQSDLVLIKNLLLNASTAREGDTLKEISFYIQSRPELALRFQAIEKLGVLKELCKLLNQASKIPHGNHL
jgi:hypothetical protein